MIEKRPTTPREVAAFTLFSMVEEQAWSDGALHYYLERAHLPARDAALATHLAYGVTQNRLLLDFYLRRFSSVRLKKIASRVHECLLLGLYQLLLLDKIPAHAAVDESVALVRHYAHANERTVAFANGVLRAAASAKESNTLPALDCPDKESYYSLRYSHPEWLVRCLSKQYGLKTAEQICRADNEIAPLSLRVNTLKITRDDALRALDAAGYTATPHETIDTIILCDGGDVATLPLFQEGLVSVQDGASAVCAQILAPTAGAFVIDCCAAPGGKSFAMAAQMQNRGHILSCDIYEHKLEKIRQGAARLDLSIVEPHLADATKPQQELLGRADFVLCDVPCSGMGIIRKKPEIRYRSEADTAALPPLQEQILQNGANDLKASGTLVYSTCTILQQENEAVVRAFLTENADFELVPFAHPTCGQTDGMYTFFPHQNNTDGFFVAKMRKKK